MNKKTIYLVTQSRPDSEPVVQIAYTRTEAETIAMAWIGELLVDTITDGNEYTTQDDMRTIGATFNKLKIVRTDFNCFCYANYEDILIDILEQSIDMDRFPN